MLVFYPSDFSPVCTDQLSVYQEVLPEFEERGLKLYGISVDNAFCHNAFQKQLGISSPVAGRLPPQGRGDQEVRRLHRGLRGRQEVLVMIGPDLQVEWVHKGPPLEIPGANLIFDALDQHAPA